MNTGRGAGQATLSARQLYQRFRQIIHEGAKFGIVGGLGVVVVLVGSDSLHYELSLGKFTSVTIATVFATVVTFLGNRYWSFRHRQGGGTRNETILFFILNGVGLLIQYACIFLVTDLIGASGRLWFTIANFAGIGIGTLFRFWSYRKWIWVHPEVALAKLRRGRHRKGRTTPVPPLPTSPFPDPPFRDPSLREPPFGDPAYPAPSYPDPTRQAWPPQPVPAGPYAAEPPPLAKRQVGPPPQHSPSHPMHSAHTAPPTYPASPAHPGYPPPSAHPGYPRPPTHPGHTASPAHSGHPASPAYPAVQPRLAATHTPVPIVEGPDGWAS